MSETWVPSLREYAAWYQINGRRLERRARSSCTPGPVNRGVELSGEVVDSPQAVITAQVEAGVVVRMAVLYELLSGRPRRVPGVRRGPRADAAGRATPARAAAARGAIRAGTA